MIFIPDESFRDCRNERESTYRTDLDKDAACEPSIVISRVESKRFHQRLPDVIVLWRWISSDQGSRSRREEKDSTNFTQISWTREISDDDNGVYGVFFNPRARRSNSVTMIRTCRRFLLRWWTRLMRRFSRGWATKAITDWVNNQTKSASSLSGFFTNHVQSKLPGDCFRFEWFLQNDFLQRLNDGNDDYTDKKEQESSLKNSKCFFKS